MGRDDDETAPGYGGGDSAIGDSLFGALVATPDGAEARLAAIHARHAPGTRIDDQYQIERAIGRGGMGLVYLAHDEQLGRDVAIKIGRATTPAALQRVGHEARALARLSHPNVVTIFHVGATAGCPYIAMEYVAGGTARQWLAVRPRTWREIVALYAAAGDGLAAAHDAGLVHRDFKPDNVLVGLDGRPRVADFGIVGGGDAPAGAIAGTPAYMAPEQSTGEHVDARADQYAWCASVWEALFGERPFGDTDADVAPSARVAPPPPRDRRSVPRRIEAALRRGLANDRDARWPSVAALLAAIRRRPLASWRVGIAAAAIALAGVATWSVWPTRSATAAGTAAAAAACPPRDPDLAHVYVAADAALGGNGTAACPLRTIGAALAAPRRGHVTVHVAAGRYDRASGERFPLVVTGDVAIEGAGREVTRVVGTGPLDRDYGPLSRVDVTFEVGDTRARVSLAGLAIQGDTPQPETGRFGILCDRGNLTDFAGEPAPANTVLTGLEVGPGFDSGIVATSKYDGVRGACNFALTSSIVHGSYGGIWTTGCSDHGDLEPVRADIGDGTDAGRNVFEGLHSAERRGIAINAWDCTRDLRVRKNMFLDSDDGIWITRHPADQNTPAQMIRVTIDNNRFQGISNYALFLVRVAAIDELVGNVFWKNQHDAPTPSERAVAIGLEPHDEPGYPAIRRARGNHFSHNDVALELYGAPDLGKAVVDFGTPGDPGGNVFTCNATLRGAAGYDVELAGARGSGALALAGNTWDHAAPTVARGSGAANGTDLVVPVGVAADTSGAQADVNGCP